MTSTKTFKLELIPELNVDNDHVNNIGVKLYFISKDGFEHQLLYSNFFEHQLLYSSFKEATERLLQIIELMEEE